MIVDNIKELLEGQAKELITSLETQIEEQAIENQKLEAEQEEVNSKLYWLNLENEQLKKEIGSINTISKLMKVSDNNLDDALNLFGFIPFHNYNDGMNKVPAWFKCLIKYYDQKEKLFEIYDLLKVSYPQYAKNIKLPYEYNEDELDILFENLGNLYVCNGEIFDNNLGFWYREAAPFQFDITRNLKHNYAQLPWQFILKNPLLLTEKYFNKIVDAIKRNASHACYFCELHKYQDLTEDQITMIAKMVLNNNCDWEIYRKFLERSVSLIKDKNILNRLLASASTNSYSGFYWKKFPFEYQLKFIGMQKDLRSKINLVFESDMANAEKANYIADLANKSS
jgi:hypothetical protein